MSRIEKSAIENTEPTVRVRDASRWYGEILGVNKISVDIHPGVTGLVGPNGSGKSTLMNMICGLIRPDQGSVMALGQPAWNNPRLRRRIGYCSQVDRFYEDFTGEQFVCSMLELHGRGRRWARRAAAEAMDMAQLASNAGRKIRAYSKGMRQRVKIALALAHQPDLLVLDEPFNGLDPIGRHEMMQLFDNYAREGRTILLASHILHEIEQMTDRILMMSNGYVMAEGDVREVRDQLRRHPFQIYVRCDRPRALAAAMLAMDGVASVLMEDERGVTFSTWDPDGFYERLNALVLDLGVEMDAVTLADENVQSIYKYLTGRERH